MAYYLRAHDTAHRAVNTMLNTPDTQRIERVFSAPCSTHTIRSLDSARYYLYKEKTMYHARILSSKDGFMYVQGGTPTDTGEEEGEGEGEEEEDDDDGVQDPPPPPPKPTGNEKGGNGGKKAAAAVPAAEAAVSGKRQRKETAKAAASSSAGSSRKSGRSK